MKLFVVTLSFFAVAAAAPLYSDAELADRRQLPALEHEEIHDENGQFALRYVTAEGTVVSERGRLVPNANNTGYVMIIEGEYSYIGDNGQTYITKYTAGPNGYHVESKRLPVSVTAEPLLNDAKPFEVAAEHFRVAAKPIQNDAIPVDIAARPIKVSTELIEVNAEPVRGVSEPNKILVEPIEDAAESVKTNEAGRVIVQPIEFIIEPFVSERSH